MGGHTRRSKLSVKESSTVICDFAPTAEYWKQQIKVKDSIPVNQQRLTFTSQRTVKQKFALVKLIPGRQWQILVDANIEDICKELKGWRAILRSKNISAELLQPLVLKEIDELASFLHSKTANDLRQLGVPCRVFFLSFEECIPRLQTEESSPSVAGITGLDIKVDEEFRGSIFLIDLHGNFKGIPIPLPLQYVLNGSQLAAKLFMVEQTARYREDQRQRYQNGLAPALNNSNTENSEGSLEVNCQSPSNDYVLEIQQNCELTAFISRDNHRLRCIVVPVITIPLVETKSGEQHPYAHLLSEESKGVLEEPASNILALPSTLEIEETSDIAAKQSVEEDPLGAIPNVPSQKTMKKKRKKRSKKSAKENSEKCAYTEHGETGEAIISFQNPQMKISQEETSSHAVNDLNAVNMPDFQKHAEGDLQLFTSTESEMCSAIVEDAKGIALPPVENKAGTFSPQLHKQQTSSSLMASSSLPTRQVPDNKQKIDCMSDRNCPENDIYREKGHSTGACTHDETIKAGDATLDKELSPACKAKPELPEQYDLHGSLGRYSAPDNSSTSGSSEVAEDVKKLKESAHGKFQPDRRSNLHTVPMAHSHFNNFNVQRQRGDQSGGHMRLNHWSQRTTEGQYYLPHRRKVAQHFYAGVASDDSGSSAPFWRHQREGTPISSHSWSKPKRSIIDSGERAPTASNVRNARNMPAWEQMPNLQQASNGNSFVINWENRASLDSPWSLSRGQSYGSFNMHQRKSGKSNKTCNRFPDRWQAQGVLNDQMASTPKLMNVLSNMSSVHSNQTAERTGILSKSWDADETRSFVQGSVLVTNSAREVKTCESLSMEEVEPCIEQMATNTSTCSQDTVWPSELDKSSLLSSSSELAEHLHEILNAVNASYESWVLSERVLIGNCKPICEFERVAHAVAPTIRMSLSKKLCEPAGCSCDALAKQLPGVQMSDFWHWYEEPSSYGVKVKLKESSKRTGSDFQAFFVPYLSAIQLFGCLEKRKTADNGETAPLHCKRLEVETDFLNHRIPSILFPKPKARDDLCIRQVSFSETEAAGQGVVNSEQISTNTLSSSKRQCDCGVKLLYEFFEQEKPQQRKPLADRIKELVSQPVLSSAGNAQLLNDALIQDLHPASWFAVAWYPIYKIPDETFRSAFLTYHCVSCLQSTCLESATYMDTRMHTIIAPVVGMMSYNAQVKEWFSLSASSETGRNNVLQQYLTKLESAATFMARGSVVKSSSSFKHADFNFFQSRGK